MYKKFEGKFEETSKEIYTNGDKDENVEEVEMKGMLKCTDCD